LQLTSTGVTGGASIPLIPFAGGFTPDEQARFPQLSGYAILHLPDNTSTALLASVLKGQVAVSSIASDGTLKYVTSVQTAGVLDDLFSFPAILVSPSAARTGTIRATLAAAERFRSAYGPRRHGP